jgi:hypothetical protein
MKNASCPITFENVNAKLTRTYAIITFIILLLFVFTPFKAVIYVSAIDFFIRVFFGVKYSPICFSIKKVLNWVHVPQKMVNAGPKKFASKVGLIFTVLMSFSLFFEFTTVSLIIGLISVTAIGAEALFGFCVACFLYNYLPEQLK